MHLSTKLTLLFFSIAFLSLFSCKKEKQRSSDHKVSVRLPVEPDRLNPLLSTSTFSTQIESHIFMPFLHFDPKTLELFPLLAVARPTIEPITTGPYAGGQTLTFEIREEARWDNGTPVLASDYIYSLKQVMNPFTEAGAFRSYLTFLKDAQVDPQNPKKVIIYTDEVYILAEAALGNLEVYPEYSYDPEGLMRGVSLKDLCDAAQADRLSKHTQLKAFGDQFNSPAYARDTALVKGCGAYRLAEWVSGERIRLDRKENWWGTTLENRHPMMEARPRQIIFHPIPDNVTAVTLLKNETIDAMGEMRPETFLELQEDEAFNKKYALKATPFFATYFIAINTQAPKLRDKKVRRALAHLMDADKGVEITLRGMGERTSGPIHPSKSYYHRDLPLIQLDIEKAKTLLDEAGWIDSDGNGTRDKVVDGERIPLILTFKSVNSSRTSRSMALMLKENARKAGVNIEVKEMDFIKMIADSKKRDFDLYFSGWSSDPTLDDLRQIWHTSSDTPSGSNRAGFGNAASDAIIDSIRVTLDETKRTKLYHRIQEIIYEEQPYIFLYVPMKPIAIHRRFEADISVRRPGYFENTFKLVEQVQE